MIIVKAHMFAYGVGGTDFSWDGGVQEWTFKDNSQLVVFQRKLAEALLELGEAGAAMKSDDAKPDKK